LSGSGQRVGLLGGSFNPAHDGHLHISREALKHIDLDCVWWVVSPQNPLKASKDMAPFKDRLAHAQSVARDPRIRVTDVETRLDTRFTIDSMRRIQTSFPEKQFVWIMGADNLIQFPQWKDWQKLFATVPIAVFDRAPYSVQALAGKAAQVFARSRLTTQHARKLADFTPPAWTFFRIPLHPATATEIRASRTTSPSD
jgi:nicotinate-nucleotide adenylyltransferase